MHTSSARYRKIRFDSVPSALAGLLMPLLNHLSAGFWACWVFLFIATPLAHSATGVTEVTAAPDFIYIRGISSSSNSPLLVLEREAWEGAASPVRTQHLFRAQDPQQFEFAVPRFSEGRDRLYSAFQAFTLHDSGELTPVGSRRYADRYYRISQDRSPYPHATSKKGLQVQMVDDALALGIQHAALNFDLGAFLDPDRSNADYSHTFSGRTYFFRKSYLEAMDNQVRALSQSNVIVSLILLAYRTGNPRSDSLLLHPQYHQDAPNRLTAFNVVTAEGASVYGAALEFLAQRYCHPRSVHGRVSNWIIGNEVNSHWFWYNRGHSSMEQVADDYLRALRISHTAIRKFSSSARLFISLEHHWNIRYPGGKETQAFPARPFVEYLQKRCLTEGNFDWHIAFHPYPENLFECRTWLDKSATLDPNTPRITFKNLEVLTDFLDQSPMRYAPQPEENFGLQPRRIILSEQGFHAPEKPEGEVWQAAAYAFAYQRVQKNPNIDSFILHRHVDHAHEGGLNLGLWTRQTNSVSQPARPRAMYQVFKDAGTPAAARTFEFALSIIGITNWNQLAPQPVSAAPTQSSR